jgi:type VI secretion system protein ImpH
MGTNGLQDRLDVEDETLIFFAGLFSQQPHSASALERLLADYLDAPVQIGQFKGAWLPLAQEDRTRLGTAAMNNQLGVNAILGFRFWDQQAQFRIRVGPLSYKVFCSLLPCETGFRPPVQIGRIFAGEELDFDVQLVLKAPEVPGCRLSQPGPDALRLGWSSWLKTGDFARDADDAVLGSHLTRV